MPHAENTDELIGIITLGIFNSIAKEVACIPPPPPNATKVKSLGSCPLFTEINFKALVMLLFAILIIPRAVSILLNFNFFDNAVRYLSTDFISAFISPPQTYEGLILLVYKFASVVVIFFPCLPYDTGPGLAPALWGPT